MRGSISLAALAFACSCGFSSAALAEVTGVTVSANSWDTRATGWGCAPDGCVAANVLDDSIEDESRWSCRVAYNDVSACELTFVFDEPTDISEVRMAMFKGNERTRTVNFLVDGVLTTTVQTSADSLEYEAYELSATQASTIVLQDAGVDPLAWLSITGAQLMTDYDADVSGTGLVPASEEYVGCFKDMVADRVLTTVTTDDALTPAVCAAACAETSKYFYGLQQGNECWCAGCDITERDTNTDYDRHGEGSCTTPCAGDSPSTCGGDFAISLYQTTTCLATPAPTPAVSSSDCPTGSTEAALEITASWENSYWGLYLHVIEPGGVEVYNSGSSKLGDVGTAGDGRDGNGYDNPGSETYLSLNGLSVTDDAVLGDYEIWAEGDDDTSWTITARSGGEVLWVAGGVFSEFQEKTEHLTATVSAYAESDCTIDAYGTCPEYSYGADGLPPCTACAEGLIASGDSTYCTDEVLGGLDVPESIANAIVADAAGGWAGPGYPALDDGNEFYKLFIAEGAESGTVSVSGNFERDEEAALPASTALYLYVYNEDDESDYVRGQGVVDTTTGDFTATIDDIPVGYSQGILSFVLLDSADAGEDTVVHNTVYGMNVVNEGCSEGLRIKLEWDSNDDLDLWVTDPNGNRVSYTDKATNIGYVNDRNGGGWTAGNPDTGFDSSFEEYVVFSGLSGDAMLGEYKVFARRDYGPTANTWTLTASIAGAVVWVEGGVLDGSSTTMQDDDDTFRRRLFTDDYSDDYTSYSGNSETQTDVFTVTLASYDAVGC